MQTAVKTVDALEMAPTVLPCTDSDPPIRIIAIDEDDCFRDALSNELEPRGFSVTTFADGPSVLEAIDSLAVADLIVLDWDHSSSPGLALLHQLRRAGINTPVIFLTRRSIASNESVALENGAVDFIDKSRGHLILAHRFRIVARTKVRTSEREKTFSLGQLQLKTQISRAFWAGIDLDLTVGEFKIVALLAANAGHHVTYRGSTTSCTTAASSADAARAATRSTCDPPSDASAASSRRSTRPSTGSRITPPSGTSGHRAENRTASGESIVVSAPGRRAG